MDEQLIHNYELRVKLKSLHLNNSPNIKESDKVQMLNQIEKEFLKKKEYSQLIRIRILESLDQCNESIINVLYRIQQQLEQNVRQLLK